MQFYNYLNRKKEEFKPIHPGKVGTYICGPTVYDHCHLGHAKGYVAMDVMHRYLKYLGFEVRHIMNYTDVGHLVNDAEIGEDKIEKKAKAEKIDPLQIADTYIQSAEEDFNALNIKPANFNPRPSRYVQEIIKYVSDLIQKGYAYEINGSVYFSVDKFPAYGKLSGRKTEDLIAGARVEANPEKKNPLDFALWIKAAPEHILKWESPWSLGYPGWHIECSVMSADLLGQDTFDIHGGGLQNIFPHNENEITQSEACLGKPMANFWVLWGNVNAEGGIKMSKSLNNFVGAKDAIKRYGGAVIRLWILSSHYRSDVEFAESQLLQAQKNLQRITDMVKNLSSIESEQEPSTIDLKAHQSRFEEAMNDDLNTPLALSVVYALVTEVNKLISENKIGKSEAQRIIGSWNKMNEVFGIILPTNNTEIPQEISSLMQAREVSRQNKDYAKSDELREKIEKLGYAIEDSASGQKIKKL